MAARRKKRPGRPKVKKRRDVRAVRVKVSISANEQRRLRDLAKREGIPFAQLMHELMMRELERREGR